MAETKRASKYKPLLWLAKIILAIGLVWLVLYRVDLKDSLEIRDEAGQQTTLRGRLLARSEIGQWLWQDPDGSRREIPDSRVIRRAVPTTDQELPAYDPGLITLGQKAARSLSLWLGLALIPLAVLLGAWRWQILLRAGRIRLPFRRILLLALVGNFFNNALPSLVGGDIIKAYYLMSHHPERKSNSLVSLVADRIVGLSGLAIICLAAIIFGFSDPLVTKIRTPILLLAALLAGGLAVLLVPGLARMLHLKRLISKLPFQNLLGRLTDAVRLYSAQPGVWLLATAVSVLIHMLLLTSVYLAGRALAPGPSYHNYLVLLPPTWMISSIPITPGAVGLMEATYQTLFARAGVSATAALSLSLFHRFSQFLWALPGAVVYIKGPGLTKADQRPLHGRHIRDLVTGQIDLENPPDERETTDG